MAIFISELTMCEVQRYDSEPGHTRSILEAVVFIVDLQGSPVSTVPHPAHYEERPHISNTDRVRLWV